jgi:hypothetical protein
VRTGAFGARAHVLPDQWERLHTLLTWLDRAVAAEASVGARTAAEVADGDPCDEPGLFLFGYRTRPAAGARFRHDAEADLDSPATGVHKSRDGAVAGWEEVRGSSEDTVEGEDEDDENLEPEFSPPDS